VGVEACVMEARFLCRFSESGIGVYAIGQATGSVGTWLAQHRGSLVWENIRHDCCCFFVHNTFYAHEDFQRLDADITFHKVPDITRITADLSHFFSSTSQSSYLSLISCDKSTKIKYEPSNIVWPCRQPW
jgi:hypothetical protein